MIYLLTATTVIFGAMTAYFVSKSLMLKLDLMTSEKVIKAMMEKVELLESKVKERDLFIGYLQSKDEILEAKFVE